jgi:hypothetical protein
MAELLENPKAQLFSKEALANFHKKKDERIQNTIAREKPEQSFWSALNENKESFENCKVGNKTIIEAFIDL